MGKTNPKLAAEKQVIRREVGRRLEQAMKAHDPPLKRSQLARLAQVPAETISFAISGKRGLSPAVLERVASALGVSVDQLSSVRAPAIIRVPILGAISAGPMNPTTEVRLGELDVPRSMLVSKNVFALRVVGDSMTGAGIVDGDMAIFRTADGGPKPGEIVAVTMDGSTALRRFVHDGVRFWLEPANDNYKSVEARPSAFTIHGVIIGLIRRYEIPFR